MRGYAYGKLTGASPQMIDLRREMERVARSDAKVLITGESGVGKELIAREVHALSTRSHRPFIPMNCAGLPETLLESELFGHVKGSFTGAYRDKPGKLEIAHEGTIFLDEVGEMTLRMQGLLLRFLETGELQKVGAERPTAAVRVRVIAATNCDLPQRIAQGLFREDLFYRLNVIQLKVPPLRERRQDIPPMIEHFLQQFRHGSTTVRAISPEAVAALTEYPWPGNVRELENVIERLMVVGHRDTIELGDLPDELRGHHRPHSPRAVESPRNGIVDEAVGALDHRQTQLLGRHPARFDFVEQRQRDLAVGPDHHLRGQILVAPEDDLQHIADPDHVVGRRVALGDRVAVADRPLGGE